VYGGREKRERKRELRLIGKKKNLKGKIEVREKKEKKENYVYVCAGDGG
jgi:hypothetical protein